MKTIVYVKGGKAVSDFDVEEVFQLLINCYGERYSFSTTSIFHRIRLGIVRDEISHEDYQFEFDGEIIDINEYGAITNWPEGFLEDVARLFEQILRGAFEKRKLLRENDG